MRRGTRGRHYGYIALLLLVLWCLPSLPVAESWFSKNLWIGLCYWGCLLLLACLGLPRVHVPGSLKQQELVQGYVWSGAGIYLAIFYGIGIVLKSLAASPYDHSIAGLVGNSVTLLLSLAFREYTRAYGIGAAFRLQRRHGKKAVVFTALLTMLLAMTDISVKRAGLVQDEKSLFLFVVQQVLPAIEKSIVLSYLVYYGGFVTGLIYSAAPEIFLRSFPFLPQLPWLAESAVNLAYPAAFAAWLREVLGEETKGWEEGEEKKGGIYRSFACFAFAVAFSWFCVGVFPIYPSVVLTGSMEPGICPGDVVLIRKITKEQEIYALKEQDVINFSREDYTVTHRIKEVLRDEAGNVSFCTRGDNNPSEDADAVLANDINGIVIGVVPKAGLGVLLLRGGGEAPEGVMTGSAQTQ